MIFDTLQEYTSSWDSNTWYRVIGGIIAGLITCIVLIIFLYYQSMNHWLERINEINDVRTQAKALLSKARRIQKQRSEVNDIIQAEPDFKMQGYLQGIINQVGLTQSIMNTTQTTREDNYREDITTVQFTSSTMKRLAQLLEIIEKNKRLYIKELDISSSKKTPKTIDATLIVATMQPQQSSPA